MKKPKRKKHKKIKLQKKRRINKKVTIQNVLDWAAKSTENKFFVEKLDHAMSHFDWERKLVAFAKDNKIKIVYN